MVSWITFEIIKKILIIRFSSIGDIVLTSSVVRCVKEQLNCEIHFLIKPAFEELTACNPHISKTIGFNGQPSDAVKALSEEGYDLVIDLQANLKSRKICSGLSVRTIRFNKKNIRKWFLVQAGINKMPDMHQVDRFFELLSEINVSNDKLGNEIHLSESVQNKASHLGLPGEFIAVAIGANHRGKSLSFEQLESLISSINLPIVLLGGKAEMDMGQQLLDQAKNAVFNLAGTVSILESAAVIERASLLISGDTGMMHIGSAFKIPQISVWGCTSPELGMYPYLPHPDSVIIQNNARDRRPCSKLGNKCKYYPNYCIETVDVSEIITAVNTLLKE